MKKKLLLFAASLLIFSFAFAQSTQDEIPDVFWGWSYGTPSGVMSEGGTGNCYQEVSAKHYIFWIGGDVQQKYRYVDCGTGAVLGDWVDSLMGL